MMYSVMALDVLGFAPDHPLRAEALRQFDNLMVDDGALLFPAVFLAGVGHRHRHLCAGPKPSRATPRWPAPRIGCWSARSAARAIGR